MQLKLINNVGSQINYIIFQEYFSHHSLCYKHHCPDIFEYIFYCLLFCFVEMVKSNMYWYSQPFAVSARTFSLRTSLFGKYTSFFTHGVNPYSIQEYGFFEDFHVSMVPYSHENLEKNHTPGVWIVLHIFMNV